MQPTICYCNLSLHLFLTLLHCKAAIRQADICIQTLSRTFTRTGRWIGRWCCVCLAGGKRSLGLRALKAQMSGSVGAWRCDHMALNAKRHIVWPKRLAECWYLQLFGKKRLFLPGPVFSFSPTSDCERSLKKLCKTCLGARIRQKSVIGFIYTWTLWRFDLCKLIPWLRIEAQFIRQIWLNCWGDATWMLLLLKQNGSTNNILIKLHADFHFCSKFVLTIIN